MGSMTVEGRPRSAEKRRTEGGQPRVVRGSLRGQQGYLSLDRARLVESTPAWRRTTQPGPSEGPATLHRGQPSTGHRKGHQCHTEALTVGYTQVQEQTSASGGSMVMSTCPVSVETTLVPETYIQTCPSPMRWAGRAYVSAHT